MASGSQVKKKSRKHSKATNHRAASSARTGSRSKRTKNSSSRVAKKKQTNHAGGWGNKKILPDHQPFVFLWLAAGKTYQAIAELFKQEFKITITFNGVYDYHQRHKAEYELFLKDIKEVRLANAKARIIELQTMTEKLRDRIFDILDMSPKYWKDLKVSSLIARFNDLIAQMHEQSGDKVEKFKGELTGDPALFGDKVINVFADKTLAARAEEVTDPGNRLKKIRLSDTGSLISGN